MNLDLPVLVYLPGLYNRLLNRLFWYITYASENVWNILIIRYIYI